MDRRICLAYWPTFPPPAPKSLSKTPRKSPDQFTLLLAAEHGTQRRCKVMWRDDNQLGLVFVKPPAEKSSHRPGIILSTRHL